MAHTIRHACAGRQVPLLLAIEPPATRRPAGSLLALALSVLRRELHGVASATAGRRSAAYRLQQLEGRRAITLDDLDELASMPVREARAAVYALGRVLQDVARPMARVELSGAVARLTRESADVPASYVEAAADGRWTREELLALLAQLDEERAAADVVATQIARALAS